MRRLALASLSSLFLGHLLFQMSAELVAFALVLFEPVGHGIESFIQGADFSFRIGGHPHRKIAHGHFMGGIGQVEDRGDSIAGQDDIADDGGEDADGG